MIILLVLVYIAIIGIAFMFSEFYLLNVLPFGKKVNKSEGFNTPVIDETNKNILINKSHTCEVDDCHRIHDTDLDSESSIEDNNQDC